MTKEEYLKIYNIKIMKIYLVHLDVDFDSDI